MAITASEYQGRFVKTKNVSLEEGVEFEIRRLSPIDMWDGDIKNQSTADFIKKVATKATVNPQISDGKAEGCIDIRDLTTDHLNTLVSEILIFSGYRTKDGAQTDFLSQKKKG